MVNKNLGIVFLTLFLFGSTFFCVNAADIEVSQPNYLTTNSEYDRNPSIAYDGSDYWLFYTKGDDTSTSGVRGGGYNPDSDTYVVYYKTASTIEGLSSVTETKLSLSDTSRPANFDQRVVSAVLIGSDIYAFVSSGQSGTNRGLYYYKYSGGAWTGPYTLIADATARGGHVNIVSDGAIAYIAWESSDASSDFYTYDGTTLSIKYDISTDNQPKITLMGNTLYVTSIEDGTGDIEVYSSDKSTISWSSHSTAISGAGFYDPCIFNDGADLYVVTAPWVPVDRQYLIQTKYSSGTWSSAKQVSYGGYGSTEWWDYWPIGYHDGTDAYVFFTTETNSPVYSDGEIAYIKMDWDLGNDHYSYIQNAIDQANSGDTITVAAGLYEEAITIDKSLTLLGSTSDDDKNDFVLPGTLGDYDANTESVIKAPVAGNPNTVSITSSNVVLKGFVIEALDRSVTGGNDYNNLIYIDPSPGNEATMTGITIENNVIGPNTDTVTQTQGRHGVRLNVGYGDTMSATITGNKIHGTYGNGNNVFIWGTALGTTPTLPPADLSGTVIENNDISKSARSGIELSGAQFGLTIDNNRIYDNGAGHIGDDTDLKYGEGIAFVRDYIDVHAGYVDGVIISNNEIYDNDKNGIYFGPMNKNHIIIGNSIHNNGNAARGGGSTFGPGDGFRIDLNGDYYHAWQPWTAQYGSTSNIVANKNNIYDNVDYGAQVLGAPTNGFELDAEYNWWGAADGPSHSPGSGDKVSENVDYSPWLGATVGTSPMTWYTNDNIQDTIDIATSGDTINVADGTYSENVIINKPLTLNGAQHGTSPVGGRSGDESIIDGGTTTAVSISASGVVLDGFTITIANKASDSKQAGLIIANNGQVISNIMVKNNIIEEIHDSGIDTNNDVTYGILTWGTTNGPSNIDIQNNVIQNVEEYSISINDLSSNVIIDGNSITNMLASQRADVGRIGIAIGIGGSDTGPSTVTITDNILNTDLTGDGITTDAGVGIGMAFAPTDVTVMNNEITGNSEGIAVQSTTTPIVHNNNILGNSVYGVHNYGGTILDAEKNWWGSADGPSHSPGSGDKVSDNVDYDPWWADEGMNEDGTEESFVAGNCNDGEDNDYDGLPDCEDPDCVDAVRDCGEDDCLGQQTCLGEGFWSDCTSLGKTCNDGLFCNGPDQCDANGDCVNVGPTVDCSADNIPEISTCDNNPDNIHYTWDYREAFTSVCVEDVGGYYCTEGDDNISHTCDYYCGAECEVNVDCDDSDPYTRDTCLGNCTCAYEDLECVDDNDCNQYDGWYNTTNTRPIDEQCNITEQIEQEYRDYSCVDGSCDNATTDTRWINTGVVINRPNGSICNDVNGCTENDQCQDGLCVGYDVDCSEYNGQILDDQCNKGVCYSLGDNDYECIKEPAREGKNCNDGEFCTVDEVCISGDCIGQQRDCSDDYSCTDDVCDEEFNRCTNTPNDDNCAEGLICNPSVYGEPIGCGKLELALSSPEDDGVYDVRSILLQASANGKCSKIEYADNSVYFRRLCINCDSYDRNRYFRDGYHTLIVKATAGTETAEETVEFFVDGVKPLIYRTEPRDGDIVHGTTFSVRYTEANLEQVILYLKFPGETEYTPIPLEYCLAGRSQECSIDHDLSEYNGDVTYYFEVSDKASSVTSEPKTITIDNIGPEVEIISPVEDIYPNRRINVDVVVSEKVKKLEYSYDAPCM